jgi:hypothetical protein
MASRSTPVRARVADAILLVALQGLRAHSSAVKKLAAGRSPLYALAALVAALAIAIPAFGADPSAKPDASAKAKDKRPEVSVTLSGTIAKTTDEKGRPTFTMTVGGVTWELSAGPKWYWKDNSPLAPYVGKSVTVVGTHHEGDTDLDVTSVDGKALRGEGRPPWAGGPKVVGASHPGFGHGRDKAPGQLKDKTKAGTDADDANEPEASESPSATPGT